MKVIIILDDRRLDFTAGAIAMNESSYQLFTAEDMKNVIAAIPIDRVLYLYGEGSEPEVSMMP